MNINWGLFPEPVPATKDKAIRRSEKLKAALNEFERWFK
jgi:hypothetical protein